CGLGELDCDGLHLFGVRIQHIRQMFFRFERIAVLPKHIADNFRAFHRDRECTTFPNMVGTGIVRAVRFHHRNRPKVEVRIAMRAAWEKPLNSFRCLTNRIQRNSLLVGGNKIRSTVALGRISMSSDAAAGSSLSWSIAEAMLKPSFGAASRSLPMNRTASPVFMPLVYCGNG